MLVKRKIIGTPGAKDLLIKDSESNDIVSLKPSLTAPTGMRKARKYACRAILESWHPGNNDAWNKISIN